MRGIDGERGEQRKNLAQEMILEPGLLLFRHLRSIDQHDALLGQRVPQLTPPLLLLARQRRHRLRDARELLRRREPVRRFDRDAGAQLALEAGHTNHEELVEVVGRNGEKPDSFEQRVGVVVRFLEHTAVELEPRQLAIDETLRARQ